MFLEAIFGLCGILIDRYRQVIDRVTHNRTALSLRRAPLSLPVSVSLFGMYDGHTNGGPVGRSILRTFHPDLPRSGRRVSLLKDREAGHTAYVHTCNRAHSRCAATVASVTKTVIHRIRARAQQVCMEPHCRRTGVDPPTRYRARTGVHTCADVTAQDIQ